MRSSLRRGLIIYMNGLRLLLGGRGVVYEENSGRACQTSFYPENNIVRVLPFGRNMESNQRNIGIYYTHKASQN